VETSVLVALIAAAVAMLGWVVAHYLEKRRSWAAERLSSQIAYRERQLSELYGPLAFLLIQGHQAFADVLEMVDHKLELTRSAPDDPHVQLWLFYVDTVFMPRNQAIEELLAKGSHLIEGESSVPPSVLRFLKHHGSWRAEHQRWKQEGVPYAWRSRIVWPSEFEDEFLDAFERLKIEHARLLDLAFRGTAFPRESQLSPHARAHVYR
jgi:hypothetical protein